MNDKTIKLITVISHLVISLASIGALTYLAAAGVLDLDEFSDVIVVLLGAIGGYGLRYKKPGSGSGVDSLPLLILMPALRLLSNAKGLGLCLLLVLGCGAAVPILDANEAITEHLQPIIDDTAGVCEIVYENDIIKAYDGCYRLEKGWRIFQAAQEAAVTALGGEPCGRSCQK